MEKEKNRIAKIIAATGICSRRDAERKILNGEVLLNGQKVLTPAINVSPTDEIIVNGKKLENKNTLIKLFIYHKPNGLITSHKDTMSRPTIFENIPKKYGRLLSIGRLDLNSTGLLLLTNNGEFQRFMEISKFERVYKVRILGKLSRQDIFKLNKGITINGIKYGKIKVEAERFSFGINSNITLTLTEGKNREIRKIMEFLGYKVNKLHRISYAEIELSNLKLGEISEIKIPEKIQNLWTKYKNS